MSDGPFHPREPSPLEVAAVLANPINWWRLGLATNLWLMRKTLGRFTYR